MSVDTLNVVLKATTSSYEQAMARAQASLRSFSASTKPALSSLSTLTAGFGAAALGALGIGSLGAGLGFGVKLAAEAEQTHVAFTTMLGDADKATKMMEDLKRFGKETPFELPEVTDAAKKLTAFGVSAENILPTLRRIGDVSAGVGVPLNELAEIYGKAKVQGRLFAEDVNQLTGRGIPVIQQLAKQFGVTDSEVKKLVENGKVGFANLEQAFIGLTAAGSQFGGLMDKQSRTLAGRWSSFKDQINSSLAGIGAQFAKSFNLTGVLEQMTKFLESYEKEIIGGVKAGLDTIAGAAFKVADLFAELQQQAVEAATIITRAFVDLQGALGIEDAGLKDFLKQMEELTAQRRKDLDAWRKDPLGANKKDQPVDGNVKVDAGPELKAALAKAATPKIFDSAESRAKALFESALKTGQNKDAKLLAANEASAKHLGMIAGAMKDVKLQFVG